MEQRESTNPPQPQTKEGLSRTRRRLRLAVEVSLGSDSQFYSGLAGDVSDGGLFVATYHQRKVGTAVDIELTLPSGTLEARGKVQWVRDARGGLPPGFAITFDELSGPARQAIDAFCRERAPLYYDVDDSPH